MTLHELGLKYGTDKAAHGFLDFYAKFFDPIRLEVKKLLEIGVSNGQSLRMWGEYFPNATVVGMDALRSEDYAYGDMKQWPHDPQFRYYLGDQENPVHLARIVKNQAPFDVVVDDGGHTMSQQKTSLDVLYPHVTRFYVLEDLQTSFAPTIQLSTGHEYATGAWTDEQTAYDYLREHYPERVVFDRDGDRKHITAVIAAGRE